MRVCHYIFRIPIALDVVLYKRRPLLFIWWCLISFVMVSVSSNSPYFLLFLSLPLSDFLPYLNPTTGSTGGHWLSLLWKTSLSSSQHCTVQRLWERRTQSLRDYIISNFPIVLLLLPLTFLGVEPLSYYLINGVLNFNVVFILALLAPLAVEFQV